MCDVGVESTDWLLQSQQNSQRRRGLQSLLTIAVGRAARSKREGPAIPRSREGIRNAIGTAFSRSELLGLSES